MFKNSNYSLRSKYPSNNTFFLYFPIVNLPHHYLVSAVKHTNDHRFSQTGNIVVSGTLHKFRICIYVEPPCQLAILGSTCS